MSPTELAEFVRAHREKLGETRRELALFAGVDEDDVFRVENAITPAPHAWAILKALQDIAKIKKQLKDTYK